MLMAACRSCGLIFQSAFPALFGLQSGFLTFHDNSETCPRCGGEAVTQDGAFEIRGRLMKLVGQPWATPDSLSELRRLHEQTTQKQITLEEAVRQAEKIAPQAALTLKDWLTIAPNIVMMLIAAFTLYLSHSQGDASKREIEAMVDQAVREVLGVEQPQPASEAPPKPKKKIAPKRPDNHSTTENRKARRAKEAEERRRRKGR